eukprot:2729705-Amphidinium_carterae.2
MPMRARGSTILSMIHYVDYLAQSTNSSPKPACAVSQRAQTVCKRSNCIRTEHAVNLSMRGVHVMCAGCARWNVSFWQSHPSGIAWKVGTSTGSPSPQVATTHLSR